MNNSELRLDLGSIRMDCTPREIAATLAALLREMRSVIPRLRQDERDTLRQIMAHGTNRLTVNDVFPAFARESESHKTLRRFRAAQFVRPARSGRWDPDEPIEVKPFARLMWERVGEEVIFDGIPVRGSDDDSVLASRPAIREESIEPALPDEEIVDLQHIEEEEEPARRPSAASFEDDELLDPAGDDLVAFAQEELRVKH